MKSGLAFIFSGTAMKPHSRRLFLCILIIFSAPAYASPASGEYSSLFSMPLGFQVDASYTFDDNVTRGDTTRLADSAVAANLRKTAIFQIADHGRALLTGLLDGEKFFRYDGLSRVTGGVQGELQYRGSAEFGAATFSLFARAYADQYRSDLRDGQRYTTGVSMRQPMTDRLNLFAALAHNRRNGKSVVFDDSDNSAALNLDFEQNSLSTLYLGGEYRRGDVVTTERNLYGANVYAWDDVFPGLYSARLTGSTVITTLGYNMGLSSRDAVDFSWRRVQSTTDAATASGLYSLNTPAARYISNQFSVAYLVRF